MPYLKIDDDGLSVVDMTDDLLEEVLNGDCRVVEFSDGSFRELDADTGAFVAVEEA